jgi:TBC1 domain family protein 5
MEKLNNKRGSTYKNAISKFKELLKQDMRDLINTGLDGKIIDELRPVYWKIYLNILQQDEPERWVKALSLERQNYYTKLDKYITEPVSKIITTDESILLDKEDNEILNLIKLDIKRTYQEIDLFRNNQVKEILIRVLYIWSKDNTETSYIQGMNEILGTLCYALYPGKSANLNIADDEETSIYYFINSEEGFEADLFTIYNFLMRRGLKELYNYSENKANNSQLTDLTSLTSIDIENLNCSVLKKRIMKNFYYYLKIIDLELFLHIHDKVEPYIFMFRWILCLLTREFTNLKNVIYIWDCIFAFENNSYGLNFLDSMCLAMIYSLRETLLLEEDGCYMLQTLMHFPNDCDVKEITKQAMIIRELINEKF